MCSPKNLATTAEYPSGILMDDKTRNEI